MSPLNLYLATMKRNFYIRLICFIIAIISVRIGTDGLVQILRINK